MNLMYERKYTMEARKRFHNNKTTDLMVQLALNQLNKGNIFIPIDVVEINDDYSTNKSLIQHFAPGESYQSLLAESKNNPKLKPMLKECLEMLTIWLGHMIFEQKFLHSDPHGGNIKIEYDINTYKIEKIWLIDWGQVQCDFNDDFIDKLKILYRELSKLYDSNEIYEFKKVDLIYQNLKNKMIKGTNILNRLIKPWFEEFDWTAIVKKGQNKIYSKMMKDLGFGTQFNNEESLGHLAIALFAADKNLAGTDKTLSNMADIDPLTEFPPQSIFILRCLAIIAGMQAELNAGGEDMYLVKLWQPFYEI